MSVEVVDAKMADVSLAEKGQMDKEAIFKARLEVRMPYYKKRVDLFEGYLEREKQKLEAAKGAAEPIKIIMPDGAERAGVKGVTTPFDVALEISKNLAKKCVVAKVGDTPHS